MSASIAATRAQPQALAGQIKKLLVLASVILLAACSTVPRSKAPVAVLFWDMAVDLLDLSGASCLVPLLTHRLEACPRLNQQQQFRLGSKMETRLRLKPGLRHERKVTLLCVLHSGTQQ